MEWVILTQETLTEIEGTFVTCAIYMNIHELIRYAGRRLYFKKSIFLTRESKCPIWQMAPMAYVSNGGARNGNINVFASQSPESASLLPKNCLICQIVSHWPGKMGQLPGPSLLAPFPPAREWGAKRLDSTATTTTTGTCATRHWSSPSTSNHRRSICTRSKGPRWRSLALTHTNKIVQKRPKKSILSTFADVVAMSSYDGSSIVVSSRG